MKGVLVRAIVLAAGLLLACALAIDWNAVVWETSRRSTSDAQLRGDPTLLSARVAGYAALVPITDDQPVRRGDLLYAIEDDDYRARVDEAAAGLDQARAGVALAAADLAAQDAQIASAEADVAATGAQLERARLERVRQDELLGTESGLRRAWEAASAEERRQAATLLGDRSAVAAARAQRHVLAAQLDQARAGVRAAQASLDYARIQLGYTRITAPVDGVLSSRLVRRGQYVSPGTALITLVPLAGVWAVASYREEQVSAMRPGQPAAVHVDAFPGVTLRGRVDSIEPDSEARGTALPPDRAVGNFTKIVQRVPVKIVLDPDEVRRLGLAGRLVPGLSVETAVDVTTQAPRAAP